MAWFANANSMFSCLAAVLQGGGEVARGEQRGVVDQGVGEPVGEPVCPGDPGRGGEQATGCLRRAELREPVGHVDVGQGQGVRVVEQLREQQHPLGVRRLAVPVATPPVGAGQRHGQRQLHRLGPLELLDQRPTGLGQLDGLRVLALLPEQSRRRCHRVPRTEAVAERLEQLGGPSGVP
jgi:hypothetical protein